MLVPVLVLALLLRASTRDPPCEQGLAGMGAGAGSFHRCSTRGPPHEQLLMRLGAGGVLFAHCCHCSPSLLPSVIPPRSTPRAVAHGAGGRWCVVRRWSSSFVGLFVAGVVVAAISYPCSFVSGPDNVISPYLSALRAVARSSRGRGCG
jgi:hypothetical protein